MSRILRLLVLTLLVSTSVTSWAQNFIRGLVQFANHQPADHVVIRLRSDMIAFQTEIQTDIQGKFTFDGLYPTTYHLTIDGQGFRSYSSDIDISMSKMSYEQVTLQLDKEPEAKAVPAEGPAGSLNARIAQIPPKARKEFDAGKHRMKVQDAAGSVQHFQKAIELYPQYAEAYQLLGVVHLEGGKFGEAEPELQKAVEIEPHMSTAQFALGICRNQMAKYADAETALLRGLELDPESPDGHYELAKTYWALERWQDAEPHAQKAVTLKPDMAGAHVLLGDIALRKREAQRALDEYKDALRLDPKGPMATATQQMVSKIEQEIQYSQPQHSQTQPAQLKGPN
jgi:tetratricopeptide (TPR) repeat protein